MDSPLRIQLPTKWGPVDTAADFVIHVSDKLSAVMDSLYVLQGGICDCRNNVRVTLISLPGLDYCLV